MAEEKSKRRNHNFSEVDKAFKILPFVAAQLGGACEYSQDNDGVTIFITKDTYRKDLDGLQIYESGETGEKRDEVKGDLFKTLPTYEEYKANGKKGLFYADWKKYGATELLMVAYGLNKLKAQNMAKNLIENNYENITEQQDHEEEQLPSYIGINPKYGTQYIKSNMLAEHIRTNEHYYIVKKQGSESYFVYWYTNGYYKALATNEVKGKIKELIPLDIRKPQYWDDTYKDLMTDLKYVKYDDMFLDEQEHLINFPNGVYDIINKKLLPHDPAYRHVFQLKYNYNPDAPKPTLWLKYIDTLTEGDAEIKALLQEWFGLIISNYNANMCKVSLALHGKGNSGKSKYLNMLTIIIGSENVCSTAIQDLSSRFGAGNLYGTKAVIIDDQKSMEITDGSTYKAITGMGEIEAELKGKQAFSFMYRGGITFTCNNMPYIKDDKGSHMFERMLIVPCDNVIPVDERDPLFLSKIKKEAEGVILWALEGLERLISNGFKLTKSSRCEQAMDDYKAKNDTFYNFLRETYDITGNPKDRIKKTELEERYTKWANENGYEPIHKKNIEERARLNNILCGKYAGYYYYKGLEEKLPF